MRTIQVGSRTLELDYDEGEYDTDLNDDDPSKEIVLSRQFHKIYQEMWATKTQNIVIKGSKGSGKSRVCAMWIIYNMMKYPKASTLVVRKFKESIKDSIYAELKWAIHKFHADGAWKCNTSPMEMSFTRDPTKPQEVQKILFRGLDDPQKVASIGVDYGHLCWVLWEEASQITSEEDFDKINMSIRGQLPDYLWKRVMVIFNPWSEKHWLKKRFFDEPDDRTYTLTTTFRHNPWLSDDNLAEYVELYDRSPRTARIICDGEWGIAGGLVYEDWEAADFDMTQIRAQYPDLRFSYGLDFGFVNDPTAFVAIAVDELSRQIWIFDCMYEYGWDNLKIARRLTQMGYADKVIACDSAEQKSIYELKRGYQTPALDENNDQIYDVDGHALTDTWVLPNAVMAMKGPDSIRNGIRDLQSYHLIVHRHKCVPVLDELSNYAFMEDKDGALTDQPMDEYNHCLVAGTMVETDHGAVPIEDIEVGDMVLTHLGYRKVLASGITRPEPVEIWRVTFEDGTEIEGTFDHDIMTTEGYKNLGCITICDKVVQYQKNLLNTTVASVSSTMGYTGTETPMQKQGICACITEQALIQNLISCTGTSGRNTTAPSHQDVISITSTAIPTTTTSPISNVSLVPSMYGNTLGLKSTENLSVNSCPILNLHRNVHAENGMLPKKAMNGMFNRERGLQRIFSPSNRPVNTAVRSTWQNHLMGSSVQMPASQQLVGHPESITRTAFVWYVERLSQSTNIAKQNTAPESAEAYLELERIARECRLLSVAKVEKTGRYEYVYDLTVDEAHDFFANNILVSNCADALRYAKNLLMGRGKGTVVETGESPVMIDTEPYTIKRLQPCSRVYSTYDEDDGESNGLTTQSGLSLSMYARSSVNGGTR